MGWILRNQQGLIQSPTVVETPTSWMLTAPGADGHLLRYTIPRRHPGEGEAAWAGRVSARAILQRSLQDLHPLLPAATATAWVRQAPDPTGPPTAAAPAWVRQAPTSIWLPTTGTPVPPGPTLSDLADDGALTLDLFWQTVPPLIDLLRRAGRKGLTLRRIPPAGLIMDRTGPIALDAPDDWEQRLPHEAHDYTRVAAHLIHWFLCALRQTPGAPEPPTTLWAICARGLEGGYAPTGLIKLEQDLQVAQRRTHTHTHTHTPPTPTCLLIDVDSIRKATGAYLHPWLTLEALSRPDQRFDPLLALHADDVPPTMLRLWHEARFIPHHVNPHAIVDLVRRTLPKGRPILLATGAKDIAWTITALQEAGYPTSLIPLNRLQEALYLAAGEAPPEFEEEVDGSADAL